MISSASTTVDNLWAMKTDVRCFTMSLMALRIFCKIKRETNSYTLLGGMKRNKMLSGNMQITVNKF